MTSGSCLLAKLNDAFSTHFWGFSTGNMSFSCVRGIR
uniref:Uncharacterized protein n=1 Tax=Anguilla anguilla TaxID=7936 RepID=A0A0E9T433_ANGAN